VVVLRRFAKPAAILGKVKVWEVVVTVPLVVQLRFARSELRRALDGVTDDDARRRILPMNCLSWIVGHLASQEQNYWLRLAQRKTLYPHLDDLVGFGRLASTPPLPEMWEAWDAITTAADPYLDELSTESLESSFILMGKPVRESIGTLFLRNLYHYWYHTGEAMAIRQMLGHQQLPDFVGRLGVEAPYRAEGRGR
jgi:DinB superfamily